MALAKGAQGRLERYSTDCLGWVLAQEPAALLAFLDLCAKHINHRESAAAVLAALRESPRVDVLASPAAVSRSRLVDVAANAGREQAVAFEDRKDEDGFTADGVDDPVGAADDLTHVGATGLGHHPAYSRSDY